MSFKWLYSVWHDLRGFRKKERPVLHGGIAALTRSVEGQGLGQGVVGGKLGATPCWLRSPRLLTTWRLARARIDHQLFHQHFDVSMSGVSATISLLAALTY